MIIYDCLIIGGGVVGCSLLYELTKYNLNAILLEGASDVASGATKANSGIIHAGYDAEPGSLKAHYNALGNKATKELCAELDVAVNNCGSLVVARSGEEELLTEMKKRGDCNGIRTEIIGLSRVSEIEKNIADDVVAALYAPDAAIVSPYKLTIALADNAIVRGATIKVNSRVSAINWCSNHYEVITASGEQYAAKLLVNCAGSGAATVNDIAAAEHYEPIYRRGEYYLLDRSERKSVSTIVFPLPSEKGKGILIAPTVSGNIIIGPTAINQVSGDDVSVSSIGLGEIKRSAINIKSIDYGKVIRVYAGVRTIIGEDFVIKFSNIIPNFLMIMGICSPGLTSAVAIARDNAMAIAERLKMDIIHASQNCEVGDNVNAHVNSEQSALHSSGIVDNTTVQDIFNHDVFTIKHFCDMTSSERELAAATDPLWSKLVCRCELVTEAEVVAAIHSPLPATDLDAIKRRVRCGMGRCQGGFCSSRIMEIIARECGVDIASVTKCGAGSEIITSKIKPNIAANSNQNVAFDNEKYELIASENKDNINKILPNVRKKCANVTDNANAGEEMPCK